MRSTLSETQVK